MSSYASPWDMVSAVIGDAWFSCPTRDAARWLSALDVPVFVYFFTHEPTVEPITGCVGVCHFAEVPFVFHYLPYLAADGAEVGLSDAMEVGRGCCCCCCCIGGCVVTSSHTTT